MSLGPQTWLVA